MPAAESGAGGAAGAGRPRKPTMADVAHRAGVSRALVSLVFRDQPGAGPQTRERIRRAAEELGYRPDSAARLLASGRSRTLGVLVTVHQPFQADLVEGIYPEADRLGYDVLLSATAPSRGESRAVEALLSHRCEALILLGPHAGPEQLDALGRRAPTVVVGRRLPGIAVDCVHTDEVLGIRQAVEHLVGLGHRDIVHVDGGDGAGSADRRQGYLAAMAGHGLAAHARILSGGQDEQSGIEAGRLLLGEPTLPTAVLAGNDWSAMGLLHALGRAGVDVPDAVSVVGYDDSHLSHLSRIDLTTVRQDAARQAQHAVRLVVARLDDPALAVRTTVLEPTLVVRGTTAAPRTTARPGDGQLRSSTERR
ncbi:MAG TPA: LacI family DNA-binding transcriptional regulator [Pseudonocardia sp.]|jgi:DNA-binding LacI/PurR family transcriptional regulator